MISDEQLLKAGMDRKTLTLSKQPFLRPGAKDIDLAYLLAVFDAVEQRDLHALAVSNPEVRCVRFPAHSPRMGYVRVDEANR